MAFDAPIEVVVFAAAEENIELAAVVEAEVSLLKISSKAEAGPGEGMESGAIGRDSGAVGGREKGAIACMERRCAASKAGKRGAGKSRSVGRSEEDEVGRGECAECGGSGGIVGIADDQKEGSLSDGKGADAAAAAEATSSGSIAGDDLSLSDRASMSVTLYCGCWC